MTSIEWLIEELSRDDDFIFNGIINSELIKEAKQMHKKEHGDTWDAALLQGSKRAGNFMRAYEDFDNYYQETFVSKGSDEVELSKHPSVISENGNELLFDEEGNLIKELPKQDVDKLGNEDVPKLGYDVENLARQSWEGCDGCTEAEETFYLNGYVRGYNAAIADSYTEEQVKEPIKEMIKFIDDINDNDRSEFDYYYDHIMDKLKELLESKKD